jgi:Domain of unknown function (DUF5664)
MSADRREGTNPKDLVAQDKLDLSLVPDTLEVCAAHALTEGAVKYGRYNWRMVSIKASVYYAAEKRHMKKFWGGQDHDPATTVHHIDNAIACLAILRDAMIHGSLVDDRPPCPNENAQAEFIDAGGKIVSWLKRLFASHKPYQFTIADTRADTESTTKP